MKKAHILTLILGGVFILLGAFQTHIWYDEAYTVGIVNNSFSDIWQITGTDVHPPLYYWLLKIVSLFTGNDIIAFRLFSAVAVMLIGVLGYTHIRKDFGEKVGIIFSFLAFFLPSMTVFAIEIRMYAWAMLFVTLAAIYGYRLLRQSTRLNWIKFAVFGLASAYMHYYGLMAIGVINLLLLIHIIRNRRARQYWRPFLVAGVAQVALYAPWLAHFLSQLGEVSAGFWISLKFPDTLAQILSIPYINDTTSPVAYPMLAFVIPFYLYLGYLVYRERKKRTGAPLYAIAVYMLVIAVIFVISLKMPILYARYLVVLSGLLIFFLAYFMDQVMKKCVAVVACVVILTISVITNVESIDQNYNSNQVRQVTYLRKNIAAEDIIIYSEIGGGAPIAVNFLNHQQYLYNENSWGVDETKEVFGLQKLAELTPDFIKNCRGKIWLVGFGTKSIDLVSRPDEYGMIVID